MKKTRHLRQSEHKGRSIMHVNDHHCAFDTIAELLTGFGVVSLFFVLFTGLFTIISWFVK